MWLQLSRILFSIVKSNVRYRFQYNSMMQPHPQKAYKGGEDAFFTSPQILVIADGVGGWAQSNIDPALYPKKLIALIEHLTYTEKLPFYIDNPKQLISDAVQLNKQIGSTTVCLFTLQPSNGLLRTYYIGDSVYLITQENSKEMVIAHDQQYSFNFPVQIGTNGASPNSGIYHEMSVTEKHRFVLASDGLWDNLDHNIIGNSTHKYPFEQLSKVLVDMAYANALKRSGFKSPFHLKAKKQGIYYSESGKIDDISVIVAKVITQQF